VKFLEIKKARHPGNSPKSWLSFSYAYVCLLSLHDGPSGAGGLEIFLEKWSDSKRK
jgi:hypothetical protein